MFSMEQDVRTGPLDEEHVRSAKPMETVVHSGPMVTQLVLDGRGQIERKTERLGGHETQWRYVYDVDGRLWGSYRNGRLAEAYQYDAPTGVRMLETSGLRGEFEREYRYGPGLRLLSAGEDRFAYDEAGRLVARTAPDGTDRFEYGPDGRISRVLLADGGTVEYDYDDRGLLDSRILDGVRVHVFEWDGLRLTNFFNGAYHAFEYGEGRMPVSMVRNGTKRYSLEFDQVGSLRAVADEDGHLVKVVEYDSWGNVLSDSNPGLEVPFGFGGGLRDDRTGLVTFPHRHYDPSTARWTTPDPIGYAGGDVDLYGYCLDDPIGGVDPLGLKRELTEDARRVKKKDRQGKDKGPDTQIINPREGEGANLSYDPALQQIAFTDGDGVTHRYEARNNVVKIDKKGVPHTPIEGGYRSSDVTVYDPPLGEMKPYGPGNRNTSDKNDDMYTYIDTGHPNGKDIHGGGSGASDPFAPEQGWRKTHGCIRMQNRDVDSLGRKIIKYKKKHKSKVPFEVEKR